MDAPILVLGANGGIGEALAVELARNGHDVIATARRAETLRELSKKHRLGTDAVDVADQDSIDSLIDRVDQGGGLKGIAYCIGSIDIMPFGKASDDSFQQSMDINLLGAVRVLRAAERALVKGGGSVVLFSSIAAGQGFGNHSVISAAKGAVEGLARALAAEWAPHVRVNCIAPSLTQTALAAPLTRSRPMAENIAAMHPIPRLGEAADSAGLAAYLLDDDAGWITGQVFHVDGGRSALRVRG